MKLISLIVIAICITTYAIIPGTLKTPPKPKSNNSTIKSKGFAVVELFTSEGCSSCPSADKVVAKIQQEESNEPVYILAYHVDYWNKLGWKDVFSDAEYTKRQGDYANWLNLGSIYTPQVVVNGKKEFVGSEEDMLRKAIEGNLLDSGATSIELSGVEINNHNISLHYDVEKGPEDAILQLALVQKSAKTVVKRGENGGRILSHVQIVRKLQSISFNVSKNGGSKIDIPSDLDNKNLEVIAFVQNLHTGEIMAAAKGVL